MGPRQGESCQGVHLSVQEIAAVGRLDGLCNAYARKVSLAALHKLLQAPLRVVTKRE